MLNSINTHDDAERYELMYGCFNLFAEVDINGDGNMEWSEFMQYIIDAVDGNNIQSGENKESVAEQLEQLKATRFKRFQVSRLPLDVTNHMADIVSTIHFPTLKEVACIERY